MELIVAHGDGHTWPGNEELLQYLAVDGEGALWALGSVLTETDVTLMRLEGDDWTTFSPPDTMAAAVLNGADQLLVDVRGTAWFGGRGEAGLVSLDGETWLTHLKHEHISDIALALDGSVWVVGEDGLFAVTP